MELTSDLIVPAVGGLMLRFMSAAERLYWLYLVGAGLITWLIWLHRRRQDGVGFFSFCFPSRVWLHPSAWLDCLYFLVNTVLMFTLFLPVLLLATDLSEAAAAWVAPAASIRLGLPALSLTVTLVSLLVMDFGIFFAHTMFHRVGVLWEFHKVHHSASVLVPFTLFRQHPVELFCVVLFVALLEGIANGALSAIAGGGPPTGYTILGINVLLFAYYLLGYNLRHSHVWLSYPRWLSHLLISPAQHQIHHSRESRHLDKNMGLVFAFWDWAAGSLYVPQGQERFDMGLTGGEHEEFTSLRALYLLPFRKAWRRLAGTTAP